MRIQRPVFKHPTPSLRTQKLYHKNTGLIHTSAVQCTFKTLGRVLERNRKHNPSLPHVSGRWAVSQKRSPEPLNQIELKRNRDPREQAQWGCQCVLGGCCKRWGNSNCTGPAWVLNKLFGLEDPVAEKSWNQSQTKTSCLDRPKQQLLLC